MCVYVCMCVCECVLSHTNKCVPALQCVRGRRREIHHCRCSQSHTSALPSLVNELMNDAFI